MMKKKRISDSNSKTKVDVSDPIAPKSIGLFDTVAFTLGVLSIFVGWESFRNAFSSPDRTICFTLVTIGWIVALFRSNWRGEVTRLRMGTAVVGYSIALLLVCLATAFSNPQSSQLALSFMVMGWFASRIRGESISQSIFLGAVFSIPLVVDFFEFCGCFDWLESKTVSITSLMADAAGVTHVVDEGTILFKQGTADHFASIGESDSVVSLFGVSVLCILAYRRGLLVSAMTLCSAVFVWVSVRAVVWVILSSSASRNQVWVPWTVDVGWYGFLVGGLLLVSLGQFFAIVFKPIPFELFNPEAPLFAYAWNWICGLPRVVLRIPQDHKISLRWRTAVKLAGKKPSFQTDCDWMKLEFSDLLFHPITAMGSVIDWARGWRGSRHWLGFFMNGATLTICIAFYCALGLSLFNRKGIQTKSFTEEGLQLCPTRTLEIACEREQESEFCKAIGAVPKLEYEGLTESLSDDLKRYLELLCRQVLAIEPNNQVAKYRLGLIASLNDHRERAELEMREITSDSQFGDFPPANAWYSKSLIIKRNVGFEVDRYDLMNHLEKASKWKDTDFRLLLLYSRMLEEQGDKKKSVEIMKQVVSTKPEVVLELAKLCARIGDDQGRIAAANQAEDYFLAKINFPTEMESDRQSVADARVLTNRLEPAAEVLMEGLRQNLGGPGTVRQLSEIQRLIYLKSIKTNTDGVLEAKLDLLEEMAETDATNPSVSGEIAKLLSFKVKPTKKLLDVLKNQISLGITDAPALLVLGENFFKVGNFKEAEKYWELAIAKEPNNFIAMNNLASCLVAISASNVDRALDLVSKAGEIAPDNPDVLDTWGEVLAMVNRHREAINKFEKAIHHDLGRMDSRRKLLASYEALGMAEMAESQSKVIAEMEKSNSPTPIDAK